MNKESAKFTVYLIAFIEMAIGLATISGLVLSLILVSSKKPLGVFVFVLTSAMISSSLGFGLLRFKDPARKLLIFFSGYVILTKILVFMGILQFTGEMITAISSPVKNTVSILYHIFVIAALHSASAQKHFADRE